ncbi:MAG: beta-galactosidase trimerization domain-containing protein [Candidatus Firestonebacteria bacterium]
MKKIFLIFSVVFLLIGVSFASDIGVDGTFWVISYYGKDFNLWKGLGINAGMINRREDSSSIFKAGFPFYNEWTIGTVGYSSTSVETFEYIRRKYLTKGEEKRLIRNPCLNDPEYLNDSKKLLERETKSKKGHNPLAYSLADEPSVTCYVKPFDFCFSNHCLSGMREWLKKEYGSLESLNKEWETHFKAWEDVRPFTTNEAKDRQIKGHENFSPWADHRTWMEITFANFSDKCRRYAEEIDPKTPVGYTGPQMPSCFGGFDWWRLCKVLTFIEAYDIGNSVEIIRSFIDSKKIFTSFTIFGGDEKYRRNLWSRFLHGSRSAIIYDEDTCKGKYTVAEKLKDVFLELNSGIGKKILSAEMENDPIAIHYSHPSIHGQWMLETGADKKGWVQWSERVSSRLVKNRNGWCKVIEDLGLQYKFVSYEQVENGELIKSGYKVFVMPESIAISSKEAKAIEEFVKSGGILIGDCQTGTMDEHCKRLKEGSLDKLFGIKRRDFNAEGSSEIVYKGNKLSFKAAESGIYISDASAKAKGSAGNVPAVIMKETEKGKSIYLNFYLSNYPKSRIQPPKEKPMRDIIKEIFDDVGIKSRVSLVALNGLEISGYEMIWYKVSDKEKYLAILKNVELAQTELGESKEVGQTIGGKISARVKLLSKDKVTDLRENKEIGVTDNFPVLLDPYEPSIYSIRTEEGK